MRKYSANLGFLWNELSLPDAIRAAYTAGFSAVECHWPYETPWQKTADALQETGLLMLGLNTSRGSPENGDNGLSALVGQEKDARAAIDEAIAYAMATGTKNVHVMAGFANGEDAHNTFVENLNYACLKAQPHDVTILIEPLNSYDAPGYFLSTTDQAVSIIKQVNKANLRLMFDCYHVQLMEGDLTHKIQQLLPMIGHVQFASVPDRGPPDQGEVAYRYIFDLLESLGYDTPLGAEYRPPGVTEDSLAWMKTL